MSREHSRVFHCLFLCPVQWALLIAWVDGQHMQGGGAVGAHTGGARMRRYGSVSQYPYGFFIGGSSLTEMNGVYIKQNPDEAALKHHNWEVAFKHDLSGWWIGVAHAPTNAAYETVGGGRNEWLLVDAAGTARFGHPGETVIPGAGTRWGHLHRDGGSTFGHPHPENPSALAEGVDAADDEDELPWQLIYIGDPSMVERLRRQGRHHQETVAMAIEGVNLPEISGSTNVVSWEHAPPGDITTKVQADLARIDEMWLEGQHDAALQTLTDAETGASSWESAILTVAKADRLRMLRQFSLAVEAINIALSAFPAFKQALHVAGTIHLDAGDAEASTRIWSQVLKLDRDYPHLCEWLARAAVDKRREPNQRYFQVLELNHDFSDEELKKAYRRLSRVVHPDREGGSTAAFEAVAAAYKTLGDPVAKLEYIRGDDIPRVKHYDGNQEPSVYEQIERKYFPERFGFLPFGDPFETKRHVQQERWNRVPPAPNGENLPVGTYLQSCQGCSVNQSTAGKLLTCTHCRGTRASRVESAIAVDDCEEGDVIGNMDGQLVCERPVAAVEDASIQSTANDDTDINVEAGALREDL